MKKLILVLSTALLLGMTQYSCSQSDEKISKEISTLLASYNDNIKVSIKDGVATVSGAVDNLAEKNQVEELLKGVKGIKSIANNIDLKAQISSGSDESISKALATAFSTANFGGINTAVKDGVVTLTGDLKRADLIKVMQIVNAASPKKIENQLKIK